LGGLAKVLTIYNPSLQKLNIMLRIVGAFSLLKATFDITTTKTWRFMPSK
jgi:hypothetical protein